MKCKKGLATAVVVGLTMALAACAPVGADDQAAGDAGDSPAPKTVAWDPEGECGVCHEAQSASMTNEACQVAANHSSMECVTCHSDIAALESVHATTAGKDAKDLKRLKATSVEAETCASCHAEGDDPALTADSTVLTDSNGLTVNPHDLPANPEHDGIVCANCHDMHSDEPLQETAAKACASCHHQGVYECYTCHE